MNGNTLALGLVGALTLVGAAQKRGSASRWDLFSPEDVHDQQSLSRRIRQLSDADKHALQADLDADRAARADPNAARERVWHGAPHRNSCWPGKCAKNCVVAAIKQDGFRLTKGERTSFFGGMPMDEDVENHAIFTAYSPATARAWGVNRSGSQQQVEVLERYVDAAPILDMRDGKLPPALAKKAQSVLGIGRRKVPRWASHHLLDDASFVEAVKAAGYASVRFKEDPNSLRAINLDPASAADTLAVFDPSRIHDKISAPTLLSLIREKVRK